MLNLFQEIEFKKTIINTINNYYDNNIFIKKMSGVEFIIINDENKLGYIDLERSSFNNLKIFISSSQLYFFRKIDRVYELNKLLNHEITHVKHFLFNKKDIYKTEKQLLDISLAIDKNNLNFSTSSLRELLGRFLQDLYLEGIASFYETEKKYSINELNKNYNSVLSEVTKISNLIISTKNKNEFRKIFEKEMVYLEYGLGDLIIYTVLVANQKMKQENIFNLTHINLLNYMKNQ